MDAVLLDLETGEPVPARERLAQLVLDAAPAAAALGCGETLAEVWSLLRRTGADEQRSVVELDGVDALVPWLVEQTEAPHELTDRVPEELESPRSKAP
jgi:gamma-glutamyl:cysteine ligase YbdK (ATP-grasp superfamily)